MIPTAVVDVEARLGCVLYLRGDGVRRRSAMETAWTHLCSGGLGRGLHWYRAGTESKWQALDANHHARWLDAAPCRRVEALSELATTGVSVEIVDLDAVMHQERASAIAIRFALDETPEGIVRLARWAIDTLPIWWGTAGWFFDIRKGRPDLAWDAIAAAAKRFWAVEVREPTTLQWDALAGFPSVGWLTMVGDALAQEAVGLQLAASSAMTAGHVYVRRGRFGTVCAAGSEPLRGDINIHQSLAAYRAASQLLEPLLLRSTRPWPGVFKRAELRQAWIERFSQPHAWLTASVDPE